MMILQADIFSVFGVLGDAMDLNSFCISRLDSLLTT